MMKRNAFRLCGLTLAVAFLSLPFNAPIYAAPGKSVTGRHGVRPPSHEPVRSREDRQAQAQAARDHFQKKNEALREKIHAAKLNPPKPVVMERPSRPDRPHM